MATNNNQSAIHIEPSNAAYTLKPGSERTLDLKVFTTGSGEITYQTRVDPTDKNHWLKVAPDVLRLAPGMDPSDVKVKIEVPSKAVAGNYSIRLIFEPQNVAPDALADRESLKVDVKVEEVKTESILIYVAIGLVALFVIAFIIMLFAK